jgi:hypothetical protein
MKRSFLIPLALALLAINAFAAEKEKPKPAPPWKEESLAYALIGPTGVRLGSAHLSARQTATGWAFDFQIDASPPGYRIVDEYRSETRPDLCSLEFSRKRVHGSRQSEDKTTFDYANSLAHRETPGGGKSEVPLSGCARDALGFLFYTRGELLQGRLPSAQTVMAGAAYQIQLENAGPQPVKLGQKTEQADLVLVSVKGPRADVSFEMYFARDPARTPLVVRCPFPIGTISLELVR